MRNIDLSILSLKITQKQLFGQFQKNFVSFYSFFLFKIIYPIIPPMIEATKIPILA